MRLLASVLMGSFQEPWTVRVVKVQMQQLDLNMQKVSAKTEREIHSPFFAGDRKRSKVLTLEQGKTWINCEEKSSGMNCRMLEGIV